MRPMVIFLVKHFLAKDKSEIKKDKSSAKTEQQGYPLVVKLQRPQVPSGELSEKWYHRHGKKAITLVWCYLLTRPVLPQFC
jgi:hypothetical protein